jgi:glucose/mannose-6-phosphate isomerase
MIDLNNPQTFKDLDPKDVYGSTGLLADQCEQIWEDAKTLSFPEDYTDFENIILCGMGGSAYSSYIIQSLFKDKLNIPLIYNNDYDLPAFASSKSLIILSSYSGTTEESLACAKEAIEKNLKVTAITNGGPLSEVLKENNMPSLIFDPKNNPSGQPRLGTGYMILGTIILLCKLGILNLTDDEVKSAISELRQNQDKIKEEAISLAPKLKDYFPLIMCSGFLLGNAHILRNQFNETSKSFAAFEDIPELNHHLMEGFKYPTGLKIKTLFLDSNLYDPKHLKRIQLTEDVVTKNNIESLHFQALGTTKLSQMLSVLSFGGFVTFYLGVLYGEDPSLIPWVDYFKEQLKK